MYGVQIMNTKSLSTCSTVIYLYLSGLFFLGFIAMNPFSIGYFEKEENELGVVVILFHFLNI